MVNLIVNAKSIKIGIKANINV